jgi:hypothetical protein
MYLRCVDTSLGYIHILLALLHTSQVYVCMSHKSNKFVSVVNGFPLAATFTTFFLLLLLLVFRRDRNHREPNLGNRVDIPTVRSADLLIFPLPKLLRGALS